MKKIVFLMPIFQTGGIERVLLNIVKALQYNYKIEIIIDNIPVKCQIYDELKKLKVNITILHDNGIPPKPKSFLKRKIWRFKYKSKLNNKNSNFTDKVLNICKNAAVIIDFFSSNMHHVITKINLDIPRIVWFHCSLEVAKEAGYLDRLADYDKVIGLTEVFCKELKSLYPYICIEHINNPIDIENIISQKEDKLPDILEGKNYFVSVARLSIDKDIDTLIKAYKMYVDKTNSSNLLCLVGRGNREDKIRELVKSLKLEEKVIFVGEQANPYPFMKHAKACILSSKSEASPCVLIESMICQTMPVCADCPTGPKELLNNGKRGFLFPVGDTKSLAEIMEKIDDRNYNIDEYAKRWNDYINQLSLETFKNTFYDKIINTNIVHTCFDIQTNYPPEIFIKLLGFIPLLKYVKKERSSKLYLFKFIPFIKIKRKQEKFKLYLFNFIPFIKIKTKYR